MILQLPYHTAGNIIKFEISEKFSAFRNLSVKPHRKTYKEKSSQGCPW